MSLGRNLGRDLLNVPMGEMISSMAFAIADAQFELDTASIRVAQLMGGRMPVLDEEGNSTGTEEDTRVYFGKDEDGEAQKVSMIELGFSPTFYQFTNNIIEVKIAIKMTYEREFSRSKNSVTNTKNNRKKGWFGRNKTTTTRTTTVDATYSSKYSYSAEGSSLLRCNLVPIPPPAIFEERVRDLFDEDQAEPGTEEG